MSDYPVRLLVMLLAFHTAPVLHAEDDFSDLKNEQTVKEVRLKAAVQAAQLQLEEIQAQAAEAKLRAAVAQAELEASLAGHQATMATKEKEIREALFGATVKPVEGTIDAASKAEAYVIASQQLDRLGREISAELRSRCSLQQGNRIFLVPGEPDATLGTKIRSCKVVMERLNSVNFTVQAQTVVLNKFIRDSEGRRPSLTSAGGGTDALLGGFTGQESSFLSAPSMLQAGLSLAALLRTDRKFSDVALQFGNSALIAAVADHLIGYPPPVTREGQPPVSTSPWLEVHSSTMSIGMSALVSKYSDLNISNIKLVAEVTELAELENHLKNDKANISKKIELLEKVVEAGAAADSKAKEALAAKEVADQKAREVAEGAPDAEKKAKEAAEAKATADKKAKEAAEARATADKKAKDAGIDFEGLPHTLEELRTQLQTTDGDLSQLLVHRSNAAKVAATAEAELKQFASGTIDGIKAADLMEAEYLGTALAQTGSYIVFLNVNMASGTNLTQRNILFNSLRVGGGVSASYHAINSSCQTVAAGTVYGYSGFYKVPTTSHGTLPSSSAEPEHGGPFPRDENVPGGKKKRIGHPSH